MFQTTNHIYIYTHIHKWINKSINEPGKSLSYWLLTTLSQNSSWTPSPWRPASASKRPPEKDEACFYGTLQHAKSPPWTVDICRWEMDWWWTESGPMVRGKVGDSRWNQCPLTNLPTTAPCLCVCVISGGPWQTRHILPMHQRIFRKWTTFTRLYK